MKLAVILGAMLVAACAPRASVRGTHNTKTRAAYGTRFWPTLLLIDKQGNIRYQHIGEGAYQETEAAIQSLLAEPYPES